MQMAPAANTRAMRHVALNMGWGLLCDFVQIYEGMATGGVDKLFTCGLFFHNVHFTSEESAA